jgi:hypothetical protein
MEGNNDVSPAWTAFTHFQTIVTIIGLFANLITLVTLVLNGKGFPQISRLLLRHQAVADSFVCIMGIGSYTQPFMWMTGESTFDFLLCQVWHGQAIYWGGVLLSVWNLVFIAVERFVMINYPYKHRNILPKHIYTAFTMMYIFSVILLGPAYLQVRYDEESGKCLNEYVFCSKSFETFMSSFAVFWFFVVYAIPIVVFIVLYTKIILNLRERQRNLGEANQRSLILEIADQQLTRMAIAVTIVFVISLSWDSWFYLLGLAQIVQYDFNTHVQIIGVFLATFNSCANPFIYSVSMSIFRKSLKKTFTCGNSDKYGESKNVEISRIKT